MDFMDYFLTNFTMFFELIGLIIILFLSAHISKKMKMYTRITIGLVLITSLTSFFESWTQTFATLSIWRPILTAMKYTMYPLILICVTFLMSPVQETVSKKWKLLFAIPEAVSIPLYFTSQWTHWICYFTKDNSWQGGTLRYWPYVIFAFYLVLFIVQNILYLKESSTRDRFMVLYITWGAIIGVILYIIFDRRDDYTPLFVSCLTFYYLFLYIHMAGTDPLTKLLNRQSYYQEIEIAGSSIDVVMSIDMNELKYFNDTYGHNKGDEALVTIARILKKNCGTKLLYRVGGDEFIALYRTNKEEEIKGFIEKMRSELAKTEYSCAFGYSMKKKSVDEMVLIADQKMYEDKKRMKEEFENGGKVLLNRD